MVIIVIFTLNILFYERFTMTKEELAIEMGISLKTLYNWEKEKPGLVKLINLGLTVNDQIEEAERHLEKLKAIRESATNSNKFKLK